MKLARAYPTFGPFVVMLGEMIGDTVCPGNVAAHIQFTLHSCGLLSSLC